MFHQGDLQSGIALAIQEAKSVVCFIRDDGSESSMWEGEWLQDDNISQLLATKAVVLRIEAGSRGAGFLSAFCPVEQPSLVVIHNGQLRENITTGVTQEAFRARLQKALGESAPLPASSYQTTSADGTAPQPPTYPGVQAFTASTPAPPTVSPPQTAAAPASSFPSVTAQTLRDERTASTKAKGKQRADTQPEIPASNANANVPSRANWLAEQRQRQQDSRRERDRVLAQIEADKAERKARREEEKRERLEREQGGAESYTSQEQASKRSYAAFTKLQVRLLDGGTIREQFSSEATITEHVRPWIDGNLETKAPYTFKQILAPQPARSISVSEEQETLQELGLAPSATLVLQPISSYTEAYGSAGNAGGLLYLPYNTVTGAYGLVTNTLTGAARWLRGGTYEEPGPDGQVLGEHQERYQQDAGAQSAAPSAQIASITRGMRVRTLADQRADRGENQQFYNGNSLDFQPDDR